MTLKDLKVGDKVFVVDQMRRGQTEERTSTEIIEKVGRKFAYFVRHQHDKPFHRDSGESAHKEWNERANGFGFDVYRNEAEYRKKQFNQEELSRLKARLVCSSYGRLVNLSPEAVDKMHDILDAEGLD